MAKEDLIKVIKAICTEAKTPLPFRKIEAMVVLKDIDACTYDVQRAIQDLVHKGDLILTDDFKYVRNPY